MSECKRCGKCCTENGAIPPILTEYMTAQPWLLHTVEALREIAKENYAIASLLVKRNHCIMMVYDHSQKQDSGMATPHCLIYEQRPQACREFQCWNMGKPPYPETAEEITDQAKKAWLEKRAQDT